MPATNPIPSRVRSRRGGVRNAATARAATETKVTATLTSRLANSTIGWNEDTAVRWCW